MQLADAGATFTSMLHDVDARDWAAVRDALADHVDLDYSALFGAPPARSTADALLAEWQRFLSTFDATQHVTGPVIVAAAPGGAVADTHVRAYHYVKGQTGGDVWMVAGHYEVRLVPSPGGWKIAGLTLRVFYQQGERRVGS